MATQLSAADSIIIITCINMLAIPDDEAYICSAPPDKGHSGHHLLYSPVRVLRLT